MPAPPANRRLRLGRWLFWIALVLAAVVGWREAPREIARWHLAAAMEHRAEADYLTLQGRGEASADERRLADAAMKQATSAAPDLELIYRVRAKWRQADGEYTEALSDCDRAVSLGASPITVAQMRGELLVHLGRHAEAVEEAKRMYGYALTTQSLWDDVAMLNGLAYYRSLAKLDLLQAAAEIERARFRVRRSPNAAFLDTRGFVIYQLGRYRTALEDFDYAVELAEEELALRRSDPGAFSVTALTYRDYKLTEEKQAILTLGVIYYHRALVLKKLGRQEEAKKDLAEATKLLGKEPDESVF